METYSLLLQSPDQKIELSVLEEASDAARSVARADCARLRREMFGVLVSGLERDEALAFQAALADRSFPTSVVADRDLPVLHESFQIQRIELRGEVLVFGDSMGRQRTRILTDMVFLAGGWMNRLEMKIERRQVLGFRGAEGRGGGMPQWITEREYKEETEPQFRLDFFFWSAPNRLHAVLRRETAIFYQNKVIRLKDRDGIESLMASLAALLPPERLNLGLRRPRGDLIYPGIPSYEREIRWHFHRLKPRG